MLPKWFVQVGKDVYQVRTPAWSNSYIIKTDEKPVLIDSGFNPRGSEIKTALKLLGFEKPSAILQTHGHFDHAAASGIFECPVYAHKEDVPYLNGEKIYSGVGFKVIEKLFPLRCDTEPFYENSVQIGNRKIEVFHTRGHTNGSVCYRYKQFLFSGDTVLPELNEYKFLNLIGSAIANKFFREIDFVAKKRSIRKVMRYQFSILCPGHGNAVRKRSSIIKAFMRELFSDYQP